MLFHLILAFLASFIAVFFLRRPRLAEESAIRFDPDVIGEDLDAYLSAGEARFPNIRAGLARQIVWNDQKTKARTAVSIVYLHGFSASPGEIRPVPDLVAKHVGANLYFARMTGHAQDGAALGTATLSQWVDDVAEAIAIGERLGERVVVMATSTGGALGTWAACHPLLSRKLAAIVLLSPNYGLKAAGGFLLSAPFARQIVHAVLGPSRSFEPHGELHALYWTPKYPTDALLPMASSVVLANRAPLEKARIPALFLYSPEDQTVDPRRIERNAARWGGRHQIIAMQTDDPSRHVLAGDALSPSSTPKAVATISAWLDNALDRNQAMQP